MPVTVSGKVFIDKGTNVWLGVIPVTVKVCVLNTSGVKDLVAAAGELNTCKGLMGVSVALPLVFPEVAGETPIVARSAENTGKARVKANRVNMTMYLFISSPLLTALLTFWAYTMRAVTATHLIIPTRLMILACKLAYFATPVN